MKRPKFLPLVGRIPAGAELHLITKVFWHQENTRKSYVWCELLLNCPAGRTHTDHWWKPGSLWELRRKAQSWQCPTASPGRAHRAQWWTWGRRGRAEGLSLAQEERTQQKKTYQILLLQGLSMYRSMFSIRMAEVLCTEQHGKYIDLYGHFKRLEQVLLGLWLGTCGTFASGLAPRILAPHSTEA